MADPESAVSGEVASGSAVDKAAAHKRERFARFRAWRASIRDRPQANLVYRLSVAVVGAVVLAGGIVAIPYPGPGWLIVFAGLGILASEFAWAHRALVFGKGKYDAWSVWYGRQHWSVQGVFALGTCAIVVGSLWVMGVLYTAAGWFDVHYEWLASPVFG